MRRVDWLTPREAAHRLGVSVTTVRRLARAGAVEGARRGGRLLVSTTSVTSYVAEEARWLTLAEAAAQLGCARREIVRLVDQGLLATRVAGRGQPAVLREDVDAVAESRQA